MDVHDWDATETPVLIDGVIDGKPRKLLAQPAVTATTSGLGPHSNLRGFPSITPSISTESPSHPNHVRHGVKPGNTKPSSGVGMRAMIEHVYRLSPFRLCSRVPDSDFPVPT